MDHAEAHERLGDLALEPERLAALDHDLAPDASALRAHLETCEECRAELASLRRTDQAIRDAFGTSMEAGPPAILRVPPGLRERVLSAAADDATTAPVVARLEPARVAATRVSRRWPAVALAAALVVAVGLGGVLGQRIAELTAARAELAEMSSAVATLDRILAAEHHFTVPLKTADGTAGGTIAWSRDEVVVLSTSLARPPDGREYACWVEENGERWRVGTMHFSGSTAYWAGPLEGWKATFDPGSRFGVSLIPAAGGEPLPVLVAEF